MSNKAKKTKNEGPDLLEPSNILGVEKHVAHHGVSLVHRDGIPRQHDTFDQLPVRINSHHGSIGYNMMSVIYGLHVGSVPVRVCFANAEAMS